MGGIGDPSKMFGGGKKDSAPSSVTKRDTFGKNSGNLQTDDFSNQTFSETFSPNVTLMGASKSSTANIASDPKAWGFIALAVVGFFFLMRK